MSLSVCSFYPEFVLSMFAPIRFHCTSILYMHMCYEVLIHICEFIIEYITCVMYLRYANNQCVESTTFDDKVHHRIMYVRVVCNKSVWISGTSVSLYYQHKVMIIELCFYSVAIPVILV